MRLIELEKLREMGEFHHATYRNRGTLWEGLWIYKKDNSKRGFGVVGSFLRDNSEIELAHDLVRNSGVSVGSYGQG